MNINLKNETARNKRQQNHHIRLRAAIIAFYGGKCVQCGYYDSRALQLDHINNDGAKERKAFSYRTIYRLILAGKLDSNRYQLLCANCNLVKQAEHQQRLNELKRME